MKMWSCYVILVVWSIASVVLGENRWVWGRSSNSEKKGRNLSGFVPTTPEPPITTFRPSRALSRGRGGFSPSFFHNRLPNHPSFFPGAFFPFDFVPPDVPRVNDDGTTKSRVTADSATLENSSGASLAPNDKYTTLDRLQKERGPAPSFPPPQRHQLGGLHPDEVFYADDDLLIIRGGGFHSDTFQEPSQPLDDNFEEDEDFNESKRVDSTASPPASDQEYNGNIPVILPPPKDNKDSLPVVLPQQIKPSPFSIFVGGNSEKDFIYVPFVTNQSPGPNDSTFETITHNHITDNGTENSSKLRRAASVVVPYVYPAPAKPFAHQANKQPVYQQQKEFVQSQVTRHHFPNVQNQVVVQSQPNTQWEPLRQYQPVVLQQTAPVPQSHYLVQGYPVVQPIDDLQYSELEIQPETPPVYHSLEGDTRVNYLPPLPSVNPEAEVYRPHIERFVVPHHFVVPGTAQRKRISHPAPAHQYSEIEIQPEHPPVFRVQEGDTRVNYLPPLPRHNPEAEAIQPQYHSPTYVNFRQRTHRPRV